MASVLLTGANGRLGSALLVALAKKGFKVRPVLREQNPSYRNAVVCDLSRSQLSEEDFKGIDFVVHAAGLVGDHPYDKLFSSNVLTTRNLLASCPSTIKKAVIASSISVYGDAPKGGQISESSPLRPKTPYGLSKLAAEKEALSYCGKFPIVLLRIGMIYGPGFEEGYFTVLDFLSRRKMFFLGKADNRIPLVHISDVCSAFLCALKAKTPQCAAYNIVGKEQMTQKQILQLASLLLDVPPPARHVNPHLLSASAKLLSFFGKKLDFDLENIRQLSADRAFLIQKAKKELKWAPKVALSKGIAEMINIYKAKRHALKQVVL